MSAVILAQVAVDDTPPAGPAHDMFAALPADPSDLTEEGLTEARGRRAANATMTAREVELLAGAELLVPGVAQWRTIR
ncbi:hypothetical protein [Streptomyces sp. NPDC052107]|uniref:hypothetical protein n=1 Tax=Streptomyces sp. NPDC052107 TaxID=3155632 RepID=UPI003444826E